MRCRRELRAADGRRHGNFDARAQPRDCTRAGGRSIDLRDRPDVTPLLVVSSTNDRYAANAPEMVAAARPERSSKASTWGTARISILLGSPPSSTGPRGGASRPERAARRSSTLPGEVQARRADLSCAGSPSVVASALDVSCGAAARDSIRGRSGRRLLQNARISRAPKLRPDSPNEDCVTRTAPDFRPVIARERRMVLRLWPRNRADPRDPAIVDVSPPICHRRQIDRCVSQVISRG